MILATEHYNIVIESQLSHLAHAVAFNKYSSIHVLVDHNTAIHCMPALIDALPSELRFEEIIISAGESHKSLESCKLIWRSLLDQKADRHSLLINLGGGVIGDMGGFCASTYMRGIDFIQLPSTLLSQVDASVGGKLAVDFLKNKNIIGVFNDPILVFIYPDFLKTLPTRELTSGFAEVIKHAIIKDVELWHTLNREVKDLSSDKIIWSELILHAIQTKHEVVSVDPFESGLRKILNFGHSIGHAIESESMDSSEALTHGEAIAVGMICESFISNRKDMLAAEQLEEIKDYILLHFPKVKLPDSTQVIHRMLTDKKNRQSQKLISCPDKIGNCLYDIPVSDSEVKESLEYYNSL